MYHHTYHPGRRRPAMRGGILMPFLLIIVIGLIAVLGFQIWSYFNEQNKNLTENKASVTLASGSAETMIWGEQQWIKAFDGMLLREGDALRTVSGTQLSLALLNGGAARLSANTEIVVDRLESKDMQDGLTLTLKKGDVWLKKTVSEGVETDFVVDTPYLTIRSTGTVFAVSHDKETAVRVLDGAVAVDVKSVENGKERIIETLKIGIGQEAIIGERELALFKQRRAPKVIYVFSDDFRNSAWYAWNRREDDTPRNVITVKEAVEQQAKVVQQQTAAPEAVAEQKDDQLASALPAPEITAPDSASRTVKSGDVIIRGTTSAKTSKIIVTTYIDDKADPYILSRYKAGETEWNYVAAERFGNLVPGQNRFTIKATDADGNESEAAELTITLDKPKQPADLSAPVILTFNGQESSETSEDVVRIVGKIGKGITKIVVNNFELTRYDPTSEQWVYYAKVAYGNLQNGENIYEVYGIDADGNKTPVTKFMITKNPPKTIE